MTNERILLDPPGLRALGRELQAAAETALEMRDRVCVEECSLLPSSSSALADEILQGARQRLHGLAGAYTTSARDLVSRADEVEACEARWWGVSADGTCGGVVLADGSYVLQSPVTGPGSTAISAAWGSGLTGFGQTPGSFGPTQDSSSSVGYINLTSSFDPLPDTSNSIGYINLTGPYSQPSDPSNSTAYINLTSSFDPLPDTSNSVGYINLTSSFDPLPDTSNSVGYINLTSSFDPPSDPSGSVGSVSLPIMGIGTVDPSGSNGSVTLPIPGSDPGAIGGFGGLYVWALGRQPNLQNEFHNLTAGPSSSNGPIDFSTYNAMLTTNYNQSTALAQASDPSRSYYDVDLTGRSDPR